MAMKSSPAAAAVIFLAAVAALVAVAGAAGSGAEPANAAAACNPTRLTPCAGPALFGGPVPAACCAQLRAQLGCMCGYARSPNFGEYVRSPNTARLFTVCHVPMPRCA